MLKAWYKENDGRDVYFRVLYNLLELKFFVPLIFLLPWPHHHGAITVCPLLCLRYLRRKKKSDLLVVLFFFCVCSFYKLFVCCYNFILKCKRTPDSVNLFQNAGELLSVFSEPVNHLQKAGEFLSQSFLNQLNSFIP